jgi:hypothetical protein
VAVLRLVTQAERGPTFDDGVNPSFALPQWRVRAWVRLGGGLTNWVSLVDTGAPVSLVSKGVWEQLRRQGRIEWVSHAPGVQDDPGRMPRVSVLGARYPYRLGRIDVELTDLGAIDLPAVRVLAQFIEDGPATGGRLPDVIVLGLGFGAFAGRSLVIDFAADGTPTGTTVREPSP